MCIRFAWITGAILGTFLVSWWNHAHAVITAKTPLSAVEGSSRYVFVAKVDKYFPDKPAMVVSLAEDIKGKAPFRLMPINCKIDDAKTFKDNQIEPLLKRFGPGIEIIFFVAAPRADTHITFAFTNGTWFQLLGTIVDRKNDKVVFSLKSAEPYFRKTFKGTTKELHKILKDHAAGKIKLPPLDDKVQPGFGPEYMPLLTPTRRPRGERDKEELGIRFLETCLTLNHAAVSHWQGPLFAVIPAIGLGAPLAILALLFPTVFGGVFVLFRQWMAFITLISLNGTLLIFQWYLVAFHANLLRGTWWSDGAALWFLMTISTFVCAFWAWRRQLNALSDGDVDAPHKTELAVLSFMSGACVLTLVFLVCFNKLNNAQPILWSDVGWTLTVVMTLGVLAGTLYRGWAAICKPTPFGSMPLATEGVILCTMLLGHVAFVPAIWGSNANTEGSAGGKEKTEASAKPVVKKWDFIVDVKGMFASSPVVDGESIFASYSEIALRAATLVRLDRQTGIKKWEFVGKKGDLLQMISTPRLADGYLYFGEGFHEDKNCKVYCVDAENGKEIWRFTTAGQTESSPAVANGKVYIGAGNDGVFCLDTKKGQKIWRYPPAQHKGRLLRFGGGISVAGKRVYCGTGIDRLQKGDKGETAVFCLDADTGKLVWKTPVPYPVWSTPVVKDSFVYVTSGNGDVFEDDKDPGGTLLCLDAEKGREKWRYKVNNGIIESPGVDGHRIYFGCRDGHTYCVGRADGKERWKHFLESPIIGTPALDTDPASQRSFGVFVAATAGKVACLNPQNGDIVWTYNLTGQFACISTSPRLVVTRTEVGFRRQLFFGCGLGGGTRDVTANRPVFYCLEDVY
jgi:outer membrane protein assembly factor BamB